MNWQRAGFRTEYHSAPSPGGQRPVSLSEHGGTDRFERAKLLLSGGKRAGCPAGWLGRSLALPVFRQPPGMASACRGSRIVVLLLIVLCPSLHGCSETSTATSPGAAGAQAPESTAPGTSGSQTADGPSNGLPAADASRASLNSVLKLPRITNSVGMEMIEIPAGEFSMGSADSDSLALPDEKPQHPVRIDRPFLISSREVTLFQFEKFVASVQYATEAERSGEGGYAFDATKQRLEPHPRSSWRATGFEQTGNHPVVNVTWNDAQAFCSWLSREERATYRLPSEPEWEYACRGGTTTRWSTGDEPESLVGAANVSDQQLRRTYPFAEWSMEWDDGNAFTAPVGSFAPNPFGLYDMHGNVFEWCEDRWKAADYAGNSVRDPAEPDPVGSRVLRGGSYLSLILFTRSADRVGLKSQQRNAITGFRVVREIPAAAAAAG